MRWMLSGVVTTSKLMCGRSAKETPSAAKPGIRSDDRDCRIDAERDREHGGTTCLERSADRQGLAIKQHAQRALAAAMKRGLERKQSSKAATHLQGEMQPARDVEVGGANLHVHLRKTNQDQESEDEIEQRAAIVHETGKLRSAHGTPHSSTTAHTTHTTASTLTHRAGAIQHEVLLADPRQVHRHELVVLVRALRVHLDACRSIQVGNIEIVSASRPES